MSSKLPAFATDEETEAFLDRGDLSEFIASDRLKPASFEFAPKEKTVSMRMPEALLEAVRTAARQEGIPYQRYIRLTLERAIAGRAASLKRDAG